ncbi:MAG: tetratricopeptide repeat protein [Nannocystaceae bacterium]|nr:tetratricopeptide repeat protein [Nannocystaceae bacterium]
MGRDLRPTTRTRARWITTRARATSLALAVAIASIGGCAKIEARDLIREGNKLYNDGKFVEAIDKYQKAEQLEPDAVTVFWNRACAAEAQVLKMKDPSEKEQRRQYADSALKDFQIWYDRLEQKTQEDEDQVKAHRLAILKADERCADLIEHWLERHRQDPKDERLYSKVAAQYEECGKHDEYMEWITKRTKDFPESVQAWHTLATLSFMPLFPDPEKGLGYNEAISPSDRITKANEVIKLLDKVTQLDPKFADAYRWRSMAYTQRQLARIVIESPQTPEERLEPILAREDTMLAWKQQKAVCDLEELPECPAGKVPETPCCPPPPISNDDQAKDAELRRQIEEEMKLIAQGLDPANPDGKGKKKKKGKGK